MVDAVPGSSKHADTSFLDLVFRMARTPGVAVQGAHQCVETISWTSQLSEEVGDIEIELSVLA
jgi:hypothetical protein